RPFTFLMDAAMLGVGVGFDTKGAESSASKCHIIHRPIQQETGDSPDHTMLKKSTTIQKKSGMVSEVYRIPDSREGWVESVGKLLNSYFLKDKLAVEFIYDDIRPAGQPSRGFG